MIKTAYNIRSFCENTLMNVAESFPRKWDTSPDFFLTKSCPKNYFESFAALCKTLVRNGDFGIVFRFILLFYTEGDDIKRVYDLDTISELFKKIKVNDNYSLDDIRGLFLAELQKNGDTDCSETFCDFSDFAVASKMTICKYILSIHEKQIPDGMPENLVKTLCEKCANIKSEHSKAYIEKFTVGILLSLANAYRFDNEANELHSDKCKNDYLSLAETLILPLYIKHHSRDKLFSATCYELSAFSEELHIVLSSFLDTRAGFSYAKSEKVSYKEIKADRFLEIINEKFDCKELLHKFDSCRMYNFLDIPKEDKNAIKNKNDEKAKIILSHSALGTPIVDALLCLDKTKNFLNPMNSNMATELFLYGITLMFLNGETEKCKTTLLEHKSGITDKYIHTPYLKLIISKLIISCDDLHDAEALKVLSKSGFSRTKLKRREKEVIKVALSLTESLIAAEKFIKGEIEEFVRLSELEPSVDEIESYKRCSRRFKRKGIDKLLYETEKIDAFINSLNNTLKEGIVPSREDYKKLRITAEAFACDQGIDLGLLRTEYPKLSSYFFNKDADGNPRPNCADDKIYGNTYFSSRINSILSDSENIIDTHYPEIEQALLWYSIEDEFDKIIEFLIKRSAYDNYLYAKELLTKEQIDDGVFWEKLEKRAKEFNNKLRYEKKNIDKAKLRIENQIKSFVKKYFPQTPDKNLYFKLSQPVKACVEEQLLTSQLVFNYLEFLEMCCQNTRFDYSAALISLTSSIELVLCEKLYKKIANNIKAANQNNRTKGNPTLGDCVYMLWDISDNNNSKIVVSNGKLTVTNPNRYFDYYGGNDCLDIPGLKRFKDLDLNIHYYTPGNNGKSERIETTRRFGDDDEENRLIFACALDYIRYKFRNPAAHKELVEKSTFENAKRSLLYGKELENAQGVLWILLSILK